MLLPDRQSSETSTSNLLNSVSGLKSHVSKFFVGSSTFRRSPPNNVPDSPKSQMPRLGLRLFDSRTHTDNSPAMRSPTSTRSVIDPNSAPVLSTQSLRHRTETDANLPPIAQVQSSQHESFPRRIQIPLIRRREANLDTSVEEGRAHRRRRRRIPKPKASRLSMNEAFKNRIIRAKAIQSIVMGFALATTLVICELRARYGWSLRN